MNQTLPGSSRADLTAGVRHWPGAVLAALLCCNGWGAPVAAGHDTPPVVAAIVAETDRISASTAIEEAELRRRFRLLLGRYFDVETMALAALADHRGALDAGQRRAYLAAYRTHLELGFLHNARKYGPVATAILGERRAPDGTTLVITQSKSRSRRIDTVFFLCLHDPARVCDLEVEGLRMSRRERREFGRILARDGAAVLISELASGRLWQ